MLQGRPTMGEAFDRVCAAFRDNGLTVIEAAGGRANAQAPGHSPADRSVSIRSIEDRVLVNCFAGEPLDDVLAAVGLHMRDLFDNPTGATYRYPDGRRVHRSPEKKFTQSGNTKGRSLFRADRIGDVDTVFVVEGEQDVLAIESVGGTAVCSAMGAGCGHHADWEPLRGKRAVIVADRDKPGRDHAAKVAELLRGVAQSVRIVEAAVGKDAADHIAAGKSLNELLYDEIDGAELLDALEVFLARFVAYPSTHALVAHVLWIVHCWFMDAWESTPRIAFLSPEPGSGKSRALEVTEPLVPRPVHAVNTTPAYLFRKVSDEGGRPTILYDEIDTVFGPKAKDNEDIRGMLNAGHRKGATAGRCVMRGKIVETEELPAYCAVALAGLDDLPDTIMTRSVVVRMRRRSPDEHIEPWRLRVNGGEAEKLRNWLTAWSTAAAEKLTGDFWPDMPAEVTDRDADVWEALLAVANLAGGDWPRRARVAAVTLVTASRQRTPSIGVLLLRDIRVAFETLAVEVVRTEQLLSELNQMEESPWRSIRRGEPLDARGISTRLNKYGIGSKAHRIGPDVVKGYSRTQFEDAWTRYLVDLPGIPSSEPVTSVTDTTYEAVVTDATEESGSTPALAGLFNPPSGPDRCDCGFHVPTQGHRDGCSNTERTIHA